MGEGLQQNKVTHTHKTSVGRVIPFGCANRCHLSVHSLAMRRSGPVDDSHGGSGGGRDLNWERIPLAEGRPGV